MNVFFKFIRENFSLSKTNHSTKNLSTEMSEVLTGFDFYWAVSQKAIL
ncbi:hypothetical protein HMPREF1863_00198 [Aedoeadaptatus coxii]|uniref:Uncharacterized protein n=1 Tax=Aedoeadaptatus coxii TaxID=755172 RepID=A0A134AKE4_9FIRM|nr:hypothetical protein HMPREF1863_00198 [Peptoniphilus coxii]